jgi:hypothetical protein
MNYKKRAIPLGQGDLFRANKAFFNNRNSVEWILAKPEIKNAFVGKSCFDMIETPPDYEWPEAIVEKVVATVEPAENFVEDRVNDFVQAVQTQWAQRNTDIAAMPAAGVGGITATERRKMVDESNVKRDDRMFQVRSFRAEQEKIFKQEVATHKQNVKDHEKKVADTVTTFRECFGPSVMTQIKTEISEGRYKAAWAKVDHYYTSLNSEAQIKTLLLKELQGAVMKNNHPFQFFVGWLHDLESQLERVGVQMPDEQKKIYLADAIRRGKFPELHTLLETHEQMRTTYPELVVALQTKITKMQIDRAQNKVDQVVVEERIQSVKASKSQRPVGNKPGMKCTKCGRAGHKVQDCWKDIKCDNCGKMGHPTERCRKKGDSISAAAGDDNGKEGGAKQQVNPANMFKKKHPRSA